MANSAFMVLVLLRSHVQAMDYAGFKADDGFGFGKRPRQFVSLACRNPLALPGEALQEIAVLHLIIGSSLKIAFRLALLLI